MTAPNHPRLPSHGAPLKADHAIDAVGNGKHSAVPSYVGLLDNETDIGNVFSNHSYFHSMNGLYPSG